MIGTNGQQEREALGLSLADVARWSGVALATIRRHEAGELIVTPSTREALARTYAAIEALRRAVPRGEELARAAGTAEAIIAAGEAARAEMRLEAQADAIEHVVERVAKRAVRKGEFVTEKDLERKAGASFSNVGGRKLDASLTVDELARSRAMDLDAMPTRDARAVKRAKKQIAKRKSTRSAK